MTQIIPICVVSAKAQRKRATGVQTNEGVDNRGAGRVAALHPARGDTGIIYQPVSCQITEHRLDERKPRYPSGNTRNTYQQ